MAPACHSLLLLCLVTLTTLDNACGSHDVVTYDLSTQQTCVEVTRGPTYDCRWKAGLNLNVDEVILHGDVVAYQIRWFSGAWSGWYVTGLNDIDWKYNTGSVSCSVPLSANTMRRVWSYFFDHTHKYILCRDP